MAPANGCKEHTTCEQEAAEQEQGEEEKGAAGRGNGLVAAQAGDDPEHADAHGVQQEHQQHEREDPAHPSALVREKFALQEGGRVSPVLQTLSAAFPRDARLTTVWHSPKCSAERTIVRRRTCLPLAQGRQGSNTTTDQRTAMSRLYGMRSTVVGNT